MTLDKKDELSAKEAEKVSGGINPDKTRLVDAYNHYAGAALNRGLTDADIGKKFFVAEDNCGWYAGTFLSFKQGDKSACHFKVIQAMSSWAETGHICLVRNQDEGIYELKTEERIPNLVSGKGIH